MLDQLKKCTAGAKCVHEHGPSQPAGNFYDYSDCGGASFTRCKSCIKDANRRRLELLAAAEVSDRVEFLKRYPETRRAALVYSWISTGKITAQEFKAIYRELTRKNKRRKTKAA